MRFSGWFTGWVPGSVLVVLAAVVATLLPASGAQAAAPRPVISRVAAFDAPLGGRGGILSALVRCTGGEVQPRVRMDVVDLRTGRKRSYRWTGDLPGMAFPRAAVGLHRVTTTGRCRDREATRTQTVRIREKTASTTVSWTEFRKIERGMTRAQVRAVVGYDGRSPVSHGGVTQRTYDMMPFWRWSTVDFRHGRVVGKTWDVDHD